MLLVHRFGRVSRFKVSLSAPAWLQYIYRRQPSRAFAKASSLQQSSPSSPSPVRAARPHIGQASQAPEPAILYEDEYISTPRFPGAPFSLVAAVYTDLVGPRPRAFNDYMEQQEKQRQSPKDGGEASDTESRKRPSSDAAKDRPDKRFKHMGRNEFKRVVKKDWEERKAMMEQTGKDPAAPDGEVVDARDSDKRKIWKKTKKLIETGTRAPREAVDGEEKEERKPKRKVAVLIGYCGTGYHGMQLNPPTKTIEGDLFEAFVKAGAISKANSDDPKKSSFIRCARTDKGVHAAGNIISLKLITESPTVLEDINNQLVPQIRVWGIIPTTNAFSCYQFCDSRVYEYLVPTYCFLPPHPTSYIAKRLAKVAEEEDDLEGWRSRYEDVPGFWQKVAEDIRAELVANGFSEEIIQQVLISKAEDPEEQLPTLLHDSPLAKLKIGKNGSVSAASDSEPQTDSDAVLETAEEQTQSEEQAKVSVAEGTRDTSNHKYTKSLSLARKLQKQVILRAKRAFRIPSARLERIRKALELYEGNHSFHNYTIQKTFKDASARRYIKTFKASDPIIIDDTEWLSLKVHGQSFMMHQIRKMVGLVMLTVRYGCPLSIIEDAYGKLVIPIPKAPALGLLLDHPVFDTYNKKADQNGRSHISFEPYKDTIQEFKQKNIYDKLFMEEQKLQTFNAFLSFLDNFETTEFEYLTSRGMKAVPEVHRRQNNEGGRSNEDEQLSALLELEADEENVDS